MGMLRAGASEGTFWTGRHQIWPLYTTRYVTEKLRRDDPERALVSLYGMLAQGFARNTFICGEGCALAPMDDHGRFMYCHPDECRQQPFSFHLAATPGSGPDLDDDGKPETLRLCFATPKRWLKDGEGFKLDSAPTAFGPVNVHMQSDLSEGKVIAEVTLPQRNPARRILLRARVPDGWHITAAHDAQKKSLTEWTRKALLT